MSFDLGDLFAAGLGMISGEEVLRRADQRRVNDIVAERKIKLQQEMASVAREHREEQQKTWDTWLRPTQWYLVPVFLDA